MAALLLSMRIAAVKLAVVLSMRIAAVKLARFLGELPLSRQMTISNSSLATLRWQLARLYLLKWKIIAYFVIENMSHLFYNKP